MFVLIVNASLGIFSPQKANAGEFAPDLPLGLQEICFANENNSNFPGGNAPTNPTLGEHCPACLVHSSAALLLPNTIVVLLEQAVSSHPQRLLQDQTFSHSFTYSSLKNRAPPIFI